MILKSTVSEFCEKKGVPNNIRDAFSAYARSWAADRYMLRHDTDTVRLLINNMTDEQMENVWREFLRDLSKILPSIQQSP